MKKPKSCMECKFATIEKKTLFPEEPPCARVVCEKIVCNLTYQAYCNISLPNVGICLDCPLEINEVKE